MSVSVVLPVHNKAWLLPTVLQGIVNNASEDVRELIIVLDGCTDASEEIAEKYPAGNMDKIIVRTPDVWEVIASNAGYKAATGDYICAVQDDMVIQQPEFDRHMLKPFAKVPDLLGVTARNAEDKIVTLGNRLKWINGAGKDSNSPRGVLYVRDVIVRGPIMWYHPILAELGYLDELFSPLYGDDYDISYKAYRRGWLVGAYRMDYMSPDHWGTTRQHNPEKQAIFWRAAAANEARIIQRYRDLLDGPKHDEDIPC